MNIGQKIKSLRIAKMLTQNELAGDNITRNMLSRIENGFALPSIQTLMYISEKLGVPAGYLLSEESEDFGYKKLIGMPEVMRAFHAGEWQICMDLCLALGGIDDEISYILSLCTYNSAKELFASGELKLAAKMFDAAKQQCMNTSYSLSNVVAECDTYICGISYISPLIVSDIDVVPAPSPGSFGEDFCRYFTVLRVLEEKGNAEISIRRLLVGGWAKNQYTDHINARVKIKYGNHSEAYHILKGLLASDYNIPAPMLYFIFSDLEVCCRELSDYRGAYEYSGDKTGMLEKFLG
jgi:transcriptional regulator with XRE-family HTH domain